MINLMNELELVYLPEGKCWVYPRMVCDAPGLMSGLEEFFEIVILN